MEATSSAEILGPAARAELLDVARRAVAEGLATGRVWVPDAGAFSESVRPQRACFVTLHVKHRLRGCVGTLQARHPLVSEVARSAHGAAFRDPRFAPVSADEAAGLEYHISVLAPSEPISFTSERDLLRQLRPGVDGVILRDGGRAGTFLPDVWDTLPKPEDFLRQLRIKAGLAGNHWSSTMAVSRYTTESFGE
jgi:uncharacterized protein